MSSSWKQSCLGNNPVDVYGLCIISLSISAHFLFIFGNLCTRGDYKLKLGYFKSPGLEKEVC
jgi:hypothetical protein